MSDWTFSHTQLSMFAQCERLYHDSYVLGKKQPKTPNMAYGTWMLHEPIEKHVTGFDWNDANWEAVWANFLAEFGGTNDFDDPVLTIKTAKKCLELYKAGPVEGEAQCVEEKLYYTFPDGLRYVSIPDFIVSRAGSEVAGKTQKSGSNHTVDLKFTTVWKVNPLLPYDDQLLGQAICAGADGFIRCTFKADKKTGKVSGPIIEEHAVDETLKAEWIEETWATCREIDSWRKKTHATWPKNSNHCYSYNRDCHRLADCKFGAVHGNQQST